MAAEQTFDSPPATLTVQPENIPTELKAADQFMGWDWEFRGEKWTKPPLKANGSGYAKSTDPKTWSSFDITYAAAIKSNWAGVGFAFSVADPYCFLDLDHCRDPETGVIDPWALEIIWAFRHTYCEVSPSGTGIRIIGLGRLADDAKHTKIITLNARAGAKVEIFDRGKYATLTGHPVHGSPAGLADIQAALDALLVKLFPVKDEPKNEQPAASQGTGDKTDDELLAVMWAARNGNDIRRLFDGDKSAHGGDHSLADLALCSHLGFYCGPDRARIDRLFRRSGLMRPKWDAKHSSGGETYGMMTIDRALAGRTEFYSPPGPKIKFRVVGRDQDEGGESPPGGAGEADEPTAKGPAKSHTLTDIGNGERFAIQHGVNVRFSYRLDKWLVWDTKRFRPDDGAASQRLAKKTAKSIYAEAAATEDDDRRKAIAKHALQSESANKIEAMLKMARSEGGIPVETDDLDRDHWLLNVENGTLNLRSGELLPHRREDLITKLAPVVFDPVAACPLWEAFVDRAMGGNAQLIAFLRRAAGYSLTGTTIERVILILFGEGKNGKSTLLEVVRSILGDYAMRTPTDTLLAKRDSGIPNDVARLKGVRFVSASEAEEGQRLAEAKVKDLTGGDMISARFMRGEFFDFLPAFKLWLSTNHKPIIRGTDEAIWDRIRLIPFLVRIPEGERDKHLREKLIAEASGILNWMLAGCLEWQRDGLGEPEEVMTATAGYRAEMDVLGGFLADCCVFGELFAVTAKDLYAAYVRWAEENGEKPMSQTAMGKRLSERGFASFRSGAQRARSWSGIRLRTENEPENDQDGRVHEERTRSDAENDINDSYDSHDDLSGKTRPNASYADNASAGDEEQVF